MSQSPQREDENFKAAISVEKQKPILAQDQSKDFKLRVQTQQNNEPQTPS